MSKLKYFTFYFFAFFCSCNEDSTKQIETVGNSTSLFLDKYDVIETGTISISIDKETADWSSKIDIYSTNDKEYLVYQNDFNDQLQFYDIEIGKKVHSVKLSTTGSNSVKCLSGFYVKSFDSIYTFCEYTYQVFLVNNRGEVIDSYKWLDEIQPSDAILSKVKMYAGNMVISKGDDLYLPTVTTADYNNTSIFSKLYVHQCVNLLKRGNKYNFGYSKIYEKENFNHLSSQTYRCLMPNGNFLFSFQADGNLYETDLNGYIRVHPAMSKKNGIPLAMPVGHSKTTPELMDEYVVKSPRYGAIFYDKDNELYYRIVLGGGEANWTKREAHRKPISILILDKRLNQVGETILDKNKFLYRNILMSSKGLLVSNANPDNPNISEDELLFSIFKPKKITK